MNVLSGIQHLRTELVFEKGNLILRVHCKDPLDGHEILGELLEVEQLSLADLLLEYALYCFVPIPRHWIVVIFSLSFQLAVKNLVKTCRSLAFQLIVPVIFDGIITSAEDELCDVRPAPAKHLRHQEEDPFFLLAPGAASRNQERI